MLLRICVLCCLWILTPPGLLGASDITLPNGIQVVERPAGNTYEAIIGYRSGVRNEPAERSGLATTVADYLFSTNSARALAVMVYGAGGEIEFLNDLDRVAIRVSCPLWLKPAIDAQAAKFFAETPDIQPEFVVRALAIARERAESAVDAPEDAFKAKVNDDVRKALFGAHPYAHRRFGSPDDLQKTTAEDVGMFFQHHYGTDRAFVVLTGTAPESLAKVSGRKSLASQESVPSKLAETRSLRSTSNEREGGLIIALPLPTMYYRTWYATLVLDGLIRQIASLSPATTLVPSIDPFYYRIEMTVPAREPVESVETIFLEEIGNLAARGPKPEDLERARRAAIEYLESVAIQQWFQGFGLEPQRLEGLQWVGSFSADDARGAAADLLRLAHVTASWEPRPRRTTIEVQDLNAGPPVRPHREIPALSNMPVPVVPAHDHGPDLLYSATAPEKLASGVSVVRSSRFAVFVAPQTLNFYDTEPDREILKSYEAYRADRILVMAPLDALERTKRQWASFKGNDSDSTAAQPIGNVTTLDLSTLMILKLAIDRRLIEWGMWNDVNLEIKASEGATLTIRANDIDRRHILDWIRAIALNGISDDAFRWAKDAAIHHLDRMRPDLQSLVWLRDPLGSFFGPENISAEHLREVAAFYFK